MNRIVIDPDILCGKPIIRGTRLSVQFVVGLLAQGWPVQRVVDNYPGIEADDVYACLEYANELLQAERVYPSRRDPCDCSPTNFPQAVVEALRLAGEDVVWCEQIAHHDPEVLLVAESRLLPRLTKDCGELAFRRGCRRRVDRVVSCLLRECRRPASSLPLCNPAPTGPVTSASSTTNAFE